MKKILVRTIFLIIICQSSVINCSAQWVSIPDSNFGKWLNSNGYAACLQGNSQIGWQMDTTCPAVVNATSMDCHNSNIHDLRGFEYFRGVNMLLCQGNFLTYLPQLPNSMTWLNCGDNLLNSLPALPDSLDPLICDNNNLTSIPPLPGSLGMLSCWNNQLTSLPILPASLNVLYCYGNQITSLPPLNNITHLNCSDNLLTSLPTLPVNLNSFWCGNNLLTTLPPLPNFMNEFHCQGNQLTVIAPLNNSLNMTYFGCDNNLLTSLPLLPPNLEILSCGYNPLGTLPALLPLRLESLNCDSCNLTTLPMLPNSLTSLSCSYNPLTSIPAFPASLYNINCRYTLLTTLPELPNTYSLYCNNNPLLTCFPQLKAGSIWFSNTAITCLPNYGTGGGSPPRSSFPLCDLFNNNGCDVFWNISGKTYFDSNNNCLFDSVDVRQENVKVQLRGSGILQQETFTVVEGFYSFDVTSYGNYEVNVDTSDIPFSVLCPANNIHYDTITAVDSFDYSKDFALTCKQGFDLEVRSVSASGFRPGNFTNVHISAGDIANFYGVRCALGISGSVTVTFNGPVTYVSSAPGALIPGNVSGNVITYNVADFGNTNFNTDFNIIVQTDSTAQTGQQVCFTVSVTPASGDNNPANNTLTHCLIVGVSYDPNNKEVYPAANIDTTQKWLTYTVNFQNTGTAEAQHIYVDDTLDNDLDISTFQLLAYSHQPLVQIKENAVRFNFPSINLPDSNANEPLSHGYVQYKIKLKDNLPIGTEINNTAFIYFDFNEAVVTNTTGNTIAIFSGIQTSSHEPRVVRIYPNPASGFVTITVDEGMIGGIATVTDITGRKLAAVQLQTPNTKLETQNLATGVYFVTVTDTEGRMVTKKLLISK